MTRAKQDRLSPPTDGTPAAAADGADGFPCMSVLLHGDAAFAGQGVVAETLNLSGLSGYRTGGTVHVVINNQLGFTTAPTSARTSVYPTDVAKMVQAPIFHVNGDDPEACVRAARLAFAFRQAFHKDVVIDLVCYRKHGHNEGDDPSYTQPLMYQRIEAKRSVRKLYTETLVRRGDITLEEAESALDDFNAKLQAVLDEVRSEPSLAPTELPAPKPLPVDTPSVETGVAPDLLRALSSVVRSVPDGFTVHPKLVRQFAQRDELVAGRRGRLGAGRVACHRLADVPGRQRPPHRSGHPAGHLQPAPRRARRLLQRRGVRSSCPHPGRLCAASAPTSLEPSGEMGNFTVRDSLLSEYAAVGLRVRLFGRGAGCAGGVGGPVRRLRQRGTDHHRQLPRRRRGQVGPVLRPGRSCLPHGYEGQGPEHSSARFERFLSSAARGNMRVDVPSTAAQYFHLLRSQAWRTPSVRLSS